MLYFYKYVPSYFENFVVEKRAVNTKTVSQPKVLKIKTNLLTLSTADTKSCLNVGIPSLNYGQRSPS